MTWFKGNKSLIAIACINLAIITIVLLFPGRVFAATDQIDSFDSTIYINQNGTITVHEVISYDFGATAHHGIYRDIPYKKTNQEGKTFKMLLKVDAVRGDKGQQVQYKTSTTTSEIKIKIGDPNATITGKHTYEIDYTVSGVLTYFTDHDELYWNITGTGWEVPIKAVTARIMLPQNSQSVLPKNVNYTCYTGAQGSSNQNCVSEYKDNGFNFSAQNLASYQGLTAVAGFPKGLTAVLEPQEDTTPILFVVFMLLLAVAWFIVAPILLAIRILKEKRNVNAKKRIVAAWFEPPSDAKGIMLNPAEVGALIDSTVDNRDVVALIIWFAQRGYIKIVQKSKKDITLTKLKGLSATNDIGAKEVKLFEGIFKKGDEVSLNDLKSSVDFATCVRTYKKDMMADLKARGFYLENPATVNTVFMVLGYLGIFGAFNLPLFLLSLIWGRKSAKRTDIGIEKYSEAVSLKNFLASQKDQLDFQAQNQMFFEKLLPYATAFGCEKVWVGKFKDIATYKADWYDGENLLMISAFTSSMSGAVGSAMSTTTSSSGFGSGFSGGFSGGGGGGGGGGSW